MKQNKGTFPFPFHAKATSLNQWFGFYIIVLWLLMKSILGIHIRTGGKVLQWGDTRFDTKTQDHQNPTALKPS